MAHKLPLYVRQHYSYKPTLVKDGWFLKCDTCGETFSLLKPPPGMPVEEHGLRMLMTHTQSHLTPKGQQLYTVVHVSDPIAGEQIKGKITPYIHPDRQTDTVYEIPGGQVVHVNAANLTHAKVKAAGVIRTHFSPGINRRHWRFNPR